MTGAPQPGPCAIEWLETSRGDPSQRRTILIGRGDRKREDPLEKRGRWLAAIEALTVFAASITIVRLYGNRLWRLPGPFGQVSLPLVVWIYVPIAILLARRRDPEEYGLTLRRAGLSLAAAAAVSSLLFPAYAAAHALYFTQLQGALFHRPAIPSIGSLLFTNLLLIGLPEEIFFRGYLHTRLEAALPRGFTVLGGRITLGAAATAVLFNASHVIAGGHWWQGNLPFGILLGWLRNRTGSVLAPAIVHGLMNVVFEVMVACF